MTQVSSAVIDHPCWVRGAVFYQIFPDRFAFSHRCLKPTNLESWDSPPTLFGYKGGDLFGATERLDHLVELGINAVYLNPIFSSTANHRYHTHDYYHVDPILGGNEAFRTFLHAAHAKGIKVILDGVFNHASRGFYYFSHTLENGRTSPFLDWFHFNQSWLDSGTPINAYAIQHGEKRFVPGESSLVAYGYQAWWDIPALPKFNTDNPEVREFILNVAEYWTRFGIDGWRLDVPNEIDDDLFWQEFRRRVRGINSNCYIVGEIWGDATRWLKGDQFDGVMNYLFSRACIGFFLAEQLNHEELIKCGYKDVRPIGAEEFGRQIESLVVQYPAKAVFCQMNLLGSHDTPRILTVGSGDMAGIKMAYLCLMSFPGAPCIYYGDEVGMAGNHDPDCRRSMSWDPNVWDQELFAYLKQCIAIRKSHEALTHGDLCVIFTHDGLVVFSRHYQGQEVLVGFNVSHVSQKFETKFRTQTDRNALNPFNLSKIPINHEGKVQLEIPPRTGILLISE